MVTAVHPRGQRAAPRAGHRPLVDDPLDEYRGELRKDDLQELGVTQRQRYPHGNFLSPPESWQSRSFYSPPRPGTVAVPAGTVGRGVAGGTWYPARQVG